ncbi:hypothetical protein LDENG_00029400 [Lucifuga dentata]|nr:hypothetical protein LDENG_00029400 [Lucifuga dentata]
MKRKRAIPVSENKSIGYWPVFADCKARCSNSKKKSGVMKFHDSEVAMVKLGLDSRHPCVILTDVLKTEEGKAFLDRKRQSLGNGEWAIRTQRESGWCREDSATCRQNLSGSRQAKKVTPERNQRSTFLSSERIRRRSQNVEEAEDKEENKEIKEVIIGKDNREEVVDCGLTVCWKQARDAGGEECSPGSRKDKQTDPRCEVQQSLKRKGADIGANTPKRLCRSVLHLSLDKSSPRQTPVCLNVDKSKEDGEPESLDHGIVLVTVGEVERTEALIPFRCHDLEERLCSSQKNTRRSSPSATIVVSSDEESSDRRSHSPLFHPLLNQEEKCLHKQPTQEAVDRQQAIFDLPDMEFSPRSTCTTVTFCELFCGCYNGKANGDIKITSQKIIIPLKDASEQRDVTLIMERKDLRHYSVWEEQQVQTWWSRIGKKGPPPAAVLQFYLSKHQVAAVEFDLRKLSGKQDGTTTSGQASHILMLTLRDPLVGLEGALLRSILDIDCLNNLIDEIDIVAPCLDLGSVNGVDDIQTPFSSREGSPELIERIELDHYLPSLSDEESADPEPNTDQDCAQPEKEKNATPQTEDESQEESPVELDTDTQLKPEDEQKEQEEEPDAETNREEPIPVYTLRHVRNKGSYCVSLIKPDSSWAKYTHQAQPHRLIQFPPPPLKGGICVTMDDLQCLDSGQYLNDVIIDFYLKYLLHNASAAVAERCYIFSSFFYNQLTRGNSIGKSGASDTCQRQWRHQRVKNWTRHVNIFKKDFLFVPVNQEAHWFLVVICFPGLDEPRLEPWTGPVSLKGKRHGGLSKVQCQEDTQSSKSSNDNTEASPASNLCDNVDTLTENAKEDIAKEATGPPNCTEQTCQSDIVCKTPCILIMDSLKRSLHQRVVKLLQEYLQSEWELRCGSSRVFSPENMKSSCCQVPLQDNSTDCGLYLLQYVESFLKDPVVNFELPLHLAHWFSRQQMWTKRDEIRNVVLKLYRHQKP